MQHRDGVGEREHEVEVVLDEQQRDLGGQPARAGRPGERARPGTSRRPARRAAATCGRQASASATSSCLRSPCDSDGTTTPPRSASPTSASSSSARASTAGWRRGRSEIRRPVVALHGQRDRLRGGHRGEQARVLQGLAHPQPAALHLRERRDVALVELDDARVRPHRAGDQLEQRGLAGSVGPDQRVPGPGCDGEPTSSTAFSAPNERLSPVQRRTVAVAVTFALASRSPAAPRGSR